MADVILSIGCIFRVGTILMIDNTYANGNGKSKSIVINSHPADNSKLFQEIHLGQVLDGGVLPIRRFIMMGGGAQARYIGETRCKALQWKLSCRS